jgi:hypothetical protein
MNAEEALDLLDTLLGQKLKDIHELVFRYSWEGHTYPQIAKQIGYHTSHIRDIGSELWQQLSQALGERVTKKNIQTVLRQQSYQKHSLDNLSAGNNYQKPYWGEAIDVSVFYGRSEELALLEQWIIPNARGIPCRLVAVVGMGGIGKTALAAKLVEQLQSQFDCCIWQSLRNAPPIEAVLANAIQILSEQQETGAPTTFDAQLSQLMAYLASRRCLLVLDNFDALFGTQDAAIASLEDRSSQYRSGYEGYGELLRRVGSERHASCLLLTSREKPKTIVPLEGEALPVRSLQLPGLQAPQTKAILQAAGCVAASPQEWRRLTALYAGNPLALKIVGSTIRDLFAARIDKFLEQGAIAFGEIEILLDKQFQRLSELEQQVMYWLAIDREWVSLAQLQTDFGPHLPLAKLLAALQSLAGRSAIEKSTGLFTLQPVVMEYVTAQLIEQVCREILGEGEGERRREGEREEVGEGETRGKTPYSPDGHGFAKAQPDGWTYSLLSTHALIQAQGKDYIRQSQIRVILAPLAARLMGKLRAKKEVEYRLKSLLFELRTQQPTFAGYAGGNLINLLHQLQIDLKGYDFSYLSIWQAYLVEVDLQQVNFAHSPSLPLSLSPPFPIW